MDLRCPSKKHGELDDNLIEIKCDSRFCGAGQGVVVIHRFDANTSELVDTLQFKDPARKERSHDPRNSASIRSA